MGGSGAGGAGSVGPVGHFGVHPGGRHTLADLDRMKTQVATGAHPWIDDWKVLLRDSQAQNTYTAAPVADMVLSISYLVAVAVDSGATVFDNVSSE
jgi:hypothetical protein